VYTDSGYLDTSFPQTAGPGGNLAIPLLFSTNARRNAMFGPANALAPSQNYQGGYAAPEQQAQVIYAVEGHIMWNPSAWALGSEFLGGIRFGIHDMDPDTGQMVENADYSMWASSSATTELASWRNSMKVLAEERLYRSFGDATSNGSWRINIRWRSNRGRKLRDDEGVFAFLELALASVSTARNRNFFRVLAKAP